MGHQLKPAVTLSEASDNFLARTIEQNEHPELYRGWPTGFDELNIMTGGFQHPSYGIVGAKSGKGKTTLMTTWALWLLRSNLRWLFCGIEEEIPEIMQRLYSGAGRIPRESFRDMGITPDEWPRVYNVHDEFSKYRSWLHYGVRTITDIETLVKQVQPQVVILDYVQLMDATRMNASNRTQELSDISRGLARLGSGDDGVLILAAAQLNEENEWLWCKDLYRDADLAIKIEDVLDENEQPINNIRKLVVPKNRQGQIGEFEATFNGALGLFEPLNTKKENPTQIVKAWLDSPAYPNDS